MFLDDEPVPFDFAVYVSHSKRHIDLVTGVIFADEVLDIVSIRDVPDYRHDDVMHVIGDRSTEIGEKLLYVLPVRSCSDELAWRNGFEYE